MVPGEEEKVEGAGWSLVLCTLTFCASLVSTGGRGFLQLGEVSSPSLQNKNLLWLLGLQCLGTAWHIRKI